MKKGRNLVHELEAFSFALTFLFPLSMKVFACLGSAPIRCLSSLPCVFERFVNCRHVSH